MEQSESINELVTALAKVQAALKPVSMDGKNPFFKSKYATLHSVWESCRQLLSDNGLALIQIMDTENGNVDVITQLCHTSGQWIRGKLGMIPNKNDPQAIGQIITYFRRYSLGAMLGIVTEEDTDGEIGQHRHRDDAGDGKGATSHGARGKSGTSSPKPMSDAQRKKLFAMCKEKTFSNDDVRAFTDWLKEKFDTMPATKADGTQTTTFTSQAISKVFDQFDKLSGDFIEWKISNVSDDDIPI